MRGRCRRSGEQDSDNRPPYRSLGDDGTRPRECCTTNKPTSENELPPLHFVPPSERKKAGRIPALSIQSIALLHGNESTRSRSAAGRVSRTRRLSTGGAQLYER